MIKSTAAARQTEESQCASVCLRADETACTWRSLSLALPRVGARHSCRPPARPPATLNVFCLSDSPSYRHLFGCSVFYTRWPVSAPLPNPHSPCPPFAPPPRLTVSPLGVAALSPHPSFSNYLSSTPLSLPGCCLLLPLFPTCPFPTHPLLLLSPLALIPSRPHLIFVCAVFILFFNLHPSLSFKHESPCSSPQMKMLVMSMALRLEESETTLQDEPSGCDEAWQGDVRPTAAAARCLTPGFKILDACGCICICGSSSWFRSPCLP